MFENLAQSNTCVLLFHDVTTRRTLQVSPDVTPDDFIEDEDEEELTSNTKLGLDVAGQVCAKIAEIMRP